MHCRIGVVFARIVVALLPFLVTACAETPYTQRSQLMLISIEEAKALGDKGRRDVLRERRGDLIKKGEEVERINTIGTRLVSVLEEKANRDQYKWEFLLFDDREINTFALPNGTVAVNTGILTMMDNDDELATVIGHEIAHVVAQHSMSRYSKALAAQTAFGIIGGLLVGTGSVNSGGLDMLGEIADTGTWLVSLQFSREDEYEADHIGTLIMTDAGYNPDAAVTLWTKMADHSKKRGNKETFAFLSTHPLDDDRITALRDKAVPDAKARVAKRQDGARIQSTENVPPATP